MLACTVDVAEAMFDHSARQGAQAWSEIAGIGYYRRVERAECVR